MNALKSLLAVLDGKKTYLGFIAAGILGLSWSSGLVSDRTAEILATLIATWTGISLRAAVQKSGPSQAPPK